MRQEYKFYINSNKTGGNIPIPLQKKKATEQSYEKLSGFLLPKQPDMLHSNTNM